MNGITTLDYVKAKIDVQQKELDLLKALVNRMDGEASQGERVPKTFTYKTPQQRRDEIVEWAKDDIRKLSKYGYVEGKNYYEVKCGTRTHVCYVNFVVNRDKRTVVALMNGYYSGKLYAKGIAKCAPNDCFNSHLGRAIALRRALGLDVPDEYLNAPQPEEVRVGDVVRFAGVLRKIVLPHNYIANGKVAEKGSLAARNGTIIDDSREGEDE